MSFHAKADEQFEHGKTGDDSDDTGESIRGGRRCE
jgi:hypothetical protein